MTFDITNETWEIKDSENRYTTAEIYIQLTQGKLDQEHQICSTKNPEWLPISQLFTLVSHYGLVKTLGKGSFGEVYLAIDLRQYESGQKDYLVALKKPTRDRLAEFAKPGSRSEKNAKLQIGQLFSKEAILTASLATCPNVISVIDHDISEPYLVIEYCNEGSLQERIKKPYGVTDILLWGQQIAQGLEIAHSLKPKQIIHRDLKPQNILLHNGEIKISDFGTSQMMYQDQILRSLTLKGFTHFYAAPEAFDEQAYPETDVWSWGVIMYQLIAQELPFNGTQYQVMLKIAECDFVPLKESNTKKVPEELCDFVESCLQRQPNKRPTARQCREFLQTLQQKLSQTKSQNKSLTRYNYSYFILETIETSELVRVYKVLDAMSQKTLTLKEIRCKNYKFHHDNLKQQMQTLAHLNHPNIVRAFEVGENNKLTYFTMDYFEHITTLQNRLNFPYTLKNIVSWGWQIASGLEAVHNVKPHPIIHRNLRPENILICDKIIKIADFGASEIVSLEDSRDSWQSGQFLFSYTAPETFEDKVHPNTDIWAWAVIMYQLIAGHLPFTGKLYEIMLKIARCDFSPLENSNPKNVPDEICKFVGQCLLKQPENRPSAQQSREFLEKFL